MARNFFIISYKDLSGNYCKAEIFAKDKNLELSKILLIFVTEIKKNTDYDSKKIMVMKTEEIYEIYDELYRDYNLFKNEIDDDRKETIMGDCHPSITLDDWAYQFYFNEDGDIFCLPNEGEAYYVASFEEDKDIVLDKLIDWFDN